MYQLEDVQLHDLGVVGEVTITKDDTLLMKVNLKLIRNIASYNTKFTKLPLKLSNVQISSNEQSLPHLNGHKTIGGGGCTPQVRLRPEKTVMHVTNDHFSDKFNND